jgi:hypothetical protein
MELQRRKLQNGGPQAPSARHFTSRTVPPGKSYAAATANRVLEAPADTHRQKNTAEQATDKWTDGGMVTLMTTVQQVMMGLQTADTEEDRFAVIMRADYGLVMWK